MFDANRVRIELCDVMTFRDGTLGVKPAAEIYLSDDEGKIRRPHKPSATIIGETRTDVLRQLASWIELHQDPSLAELAAAVGELTP